MSENRIEARLYTICSCPGTLTRLNTGTDGRLAGEAGTLHRQSHYVTGALNAFVPGHVHLVSSLTPERLKNPVSLCLRQDPGKRRG